MCQEYPRIHRNGFVLSCWNRNNNKVSHFFIYIIYRREGETECLRSPARSFTVATRQVLSVHSYHHTNRSFTLPLSLAHSFSPLAMCTFFPVLFTARHSGMCMHKLFTCSLPSVQTVRINASQATLVSCVVFYYYAVINFLSLPLSVFFYVIIFILSFASSSSSFFLLDGLASKIVSLKLVVTQSIHICFICFVFFSYKTLLQVFNRPKKSTYIISTKLIQVNRIVKVYPSAKSQIKLKTFQNCNYCNVHVQSRSFARRLAFFTFSCLSVSRIFFYLCFNFVFIFLREINSLKRDATKTATG